MNGKFGGGKGTKDLPFLIEDIWDFNSIRIYPKSFFKLTKNIDFSTPPFDNGFLPIDNFEGQLDGNGNKLLNIYINKGMDNVGLFSLINITSVSNRGVVPWFKNIVIQNANVIGTKDCAGVLVGKINYTYNVTANLSEFFSNIYISGTVSGRNYNGFLCGYLNFIHNNYQNTFARDIQVNGIINPQQNLTYNSPLFGFVNTQQSSYCNTIELVKDAYIKVHINDTNVTVALNNTSSATNTNVAQTDSLHFRLNNVVVQLDEWNGKTSSYVKEMLLSDIKKSYLVTWFSASLTNISLWNVDYNQEMELKQLKRNMSFVKNGNKYYVYNADTKEFIECYINDYASAVKNVGMSIADLDYHFYDAMKAKFGNTAQIVTFIDKSIGVKISEPSEIVMTRDSSHDYDNKQIYTTKINLLTITKDINSILAK